MESIVNWVEGAGFFARPRAISSINCSRATDINRDYTFSSCRESAADTCLVPDDITWTGDACVCSTVLEYIAKFSECIHDTPYSSCINDNNGRIMAEWSSGHCNFITTTSSLPPVTSPSPKPEPTPPSPEPTTVSPTTVTVTGPTTTEKPSSSPSPKEEPQPSSESPKPSEPPSTLPTLPPPRPETSSLSSTYTTSAPPSSTEKPPETSSEEPSESSTSTPTSIPEPSLIPVTVAPSISAPTTGSTTSSSETHIPVAKWTGSGSLLQGYCATPTYTILDGPTAYWAPVVGCIGLKSDCCPFDVPIAALSPTALGAVAETGSSQISITGSSKPSTTGIGIFPSALSPAQSTLDRCPQDYHSISGGCCPLNYYPWSTLIAGQTPCYSTLSAATTPPPIAASLVDSTNSAKPTSAIVNVVYAMQYPVKEPSKPGLAQNTKIGIGAGAGGAALVFGILIWLLLWKHRAHKRDKSALESLGVTEWSTSGRQSIAASSAVGGGVKKWRQSIPVSPTSSRFHEGLEPTLPNVSMSQNQYPGDWRPAQRAMSPPISAPYARSSIPSPPIPEGYSEADSQQGMLSSRSSYNNTPGVASDGGYSSNRSELYSGEYPFPRNELQGVPEEQQNWTSVYPDTEQHQQHLTALPPMGAGEMLYHEAPTGRMTPRM